MLCAASNYRIFLISKNLLSWIPKYFLRFSPKLVLIRPSATIWTLLVEYVQCVPCQNVCLTTNITEWYPCWYGTAKFAQSQVLTHSIFAFEKEVSCRDRKKSYNRYFTDSPTHEIFFHGETVMEFHSGACEIQ